MKVTIPSDDDLYDIESFEKTINSLDVFIL